MNLQNIENNLDRTPLAIDLKIHIEALKKSIMDDLIQYEQIFTSRNQRQESNIWLALLVDAKIIINDAEMINVTRRQFESYINKGPGNERKLKTLLKIREAMDNRLSYPAQFGGKRKNRRSRRRSKRRRRSSKRRRRSSKRRRRSSKRRRR